MAYKRKRSYGKKKRFTSKKRGFKSRKSYRKKSNPYAMTNIRGRDWMSNSLMNKMEYMTQVYFTAVGTPQVYVFRGNSIYDPDQTGTGTQPLGMANLSAIYETYECPSSYIRVEWINNTAVPMWLSVTPVNNSADTNTFNSSQGRPGGRFRYCESNQGKQHTIVTNSSSTRKVKGMNVNTSDTRAGVTANPTIQWYWSVALTAVDNATPLSGVLNVKVIYKTKWTNRKVI